MSRFRAGAAIELLSWELSSIFRPPVLEVLVPLVTFFQSLGSLVGARSLSTLPGVLCPPSHELELAVRASAAEGAAYSIGFALPMTALICAVIPAISFARDLETGRLGEELSLPVGRSWLFAAKLLAVTASLALIYLTSTALSFLVAGPWSLRGLPHFPGPFLRCFVGTALPLAAFSAAVAVASKNSVVTVLVGFIIPFSLYRIAGIDTLVVACAASGGLRPMYPSLAVLLLNLSISYVLFLRAEVTAR